MNNYHDKTDAELAYICKDANEAAKCARDLGDTAGECKYLDQVNDACTERYRRSAGTIRTLRTTAPQRKLLLDALNLHDSKVTARLKEDHGPAEHATLLRKLGDSTALALALQGCTA